MLFRPATILLFAIVLALVVCASTICLVPFGQAPFSSVYGPNSIFLAKRAAARLVACIHATLTAAQVAASIGRTDIVTDLVWRPSDRQPLMSFLTC